MSYDFILDSKDLIVGDYEAARDKMLLNKLGVTHVVACGFKKGHFQEYVHRVFGCDRV